MFARSASVALVALLSLHGIDLVDARVGGISTNSTLGAFRGFQATGSPTASPVSPAPTLPVPTGSPSDSPAPSPAPSSSPTVKPPTTSPSSSPAPSPSPSSTPTLSKAPTPLPTSAPPTTAPVVTEAPSDTQQPSPSPSGSPSTPMPTTTPSDSPQPSPSPTRNTPTGVPTKTLAPSGSPTGSPKPSPGPSEAPSKKGSEAPSKSPAPSESPSSSPKPSPSPTLKPTVSKMPTPGPTAVPTVSNEPSKTTVPSVTTVPSLEPSFSNEPSISNVPSAVPSFSDEPSISDVPTTSNNPTADRDVSYVDITVTWQGDSTVYIHVLNNPAFIGNPTPECSGAISEDSADDFTRVPDTTDAGVAGNPAAINTMNVKCPFGVTGTTLGTMYHFAIQQETNNAARVTGANASPAGSQRFSDLTVDFKVDGETVPELSGVFKSITAEGNVVGTNDFNTNTLTFRNDDGNNGSDFDVTATQVNPAKAAEWLVIEVSVPDGQISPTTDTFAISAISDPNDIEGDPSCGADVAATAATTAAPVRFVCPFYASNVDGAFEYTFGFSHIDGGTAMQSNAFKLSFIHNGVEITPSRSQPLIDAPDGQFTALETYTIRADSEEAPLIFKEPDIVFTVTTTDDDVMTLTESSLAGDCIATGATGPGTASIVCPTVSDFASRSFTLTVANGADTTAGTMFQIDFFFRGMRVDTLSGSTTAAFAAPTVFTFQVSVEGVITPAATDPINPALP